MPTGKYTRTKEHRKIVSETIKKYFSNPKNRKKHLKGKLFKKGQIPWNKGKPHLRGKDHPNWGKHPIPWNKGKKTGQKVWNKDTKGKYSKEHKRKIGEAHKGEKCTFWKGGISSGENKKQYYYLKRIERLSRQKGAEGSFTIEEWENLKKKYDFICLICYKREPEIKLTVDHIIPLFEGGSNYIGNIQPLCGSCNSSKGKRLRLDFLTKQEYKEENGSLSEKEGSAIS